MEAIIRSARSSREGSREASREREKKEKREQEEQDSIKALKDLPLTQDFLDLMYKMLINLNMVNRKDNIDYEYDIDHLLGCLANFTEKPQVSELEFNARVQDQLVDFEKSLINKELLFTLKGDKIKAPDFQGSSPLKEAYKMAVLKLVWQGSSKFSGAKEQNIEELLTHCNNVQRTYNMSEEEFKHFLLRHTTKKVFVMVHNEIKANSSVDTIYNILQFTYASGATPGDAKEKLKNFRATKEDTVVSVFTSIRDLVSKSFQEFPEAQYAPALMELESIFQFINAFPESSRHKLTENLNRLQNRKPNPTLTDFLSYNQDYFKQFNYDLKINGANPPNGRSRQYNSFSVNQDIPGVSGMEKFQPLIPPLNQSGSPPRGSFPKSNYHDGRDFRNRSQVQNYQIRDTPGNGRPLTNKGFPPNQGMGRQGRPFYQKNQEGGFSQSMNYASPYNRGVNRGKYCSLCGQTSHSAVDGCYRMKNDQNRLIQVTPVQSPCPDCKIKIKRDLYHPRKYCFLREELQKFKNKA